jgi:hypothetical protein
VSNRTAAIVVTTIFEPRWLQGYLDNLRAHGRERDTSLYIIIDRKTPPTVAAAAQAAVKAGYKVFCPTLDEQEAYLARCGLPSGFVPWNTDNRRNIGFLMALESGCDMLVSIDDDNYCLPDSDFIGEHAIVGATVAQSQRAELVGGNPWFNICELLQVRGGPTIHARGFPYSARRGEHAAKQNPSSQDGARKIAINAGLWTDDPDVDALTRLSIAPFVEQDRGRSVILAPETWSPINTQNTALTREAITAYYYVRMGFALQGLSIDRFGDILSGYFVQKCAKHLGQAVRLGTPTAAHHRTQHNLFKDLYHELAGVVLIEELLPWLQELKLSGGDYATSYAALADAIASRAEHYKGFVWDQGGREFLKETAACMRTWLGVLKTIG